MAPVPEELVDGGGAQDWMWRRCLLDAAAATPARSCGAGDWRERGSGLEGEGGEPLVGATGGRGTVCTGGRGAPGWWRLEEGEGLPSVLLCRLEEGAGGRQAGPIYNLGFSEAGGEL